MQIAWLATTTLAIVLLALSLRYKVVLDPTQLWSTAISDDPGDRYERWLLALKSIAEHPILGLGPNALVADGWTAHNTWLNLWSVLGIAPLAAFIFLFGYALTSTLSQRSYAMFAALIFVAVQSIYSDFEDLRHLWLLFGIAIGAATTFARGKGPGQAIDQCAT